jgi:hypothetical protein
VAVFDENFLFLINPAGGVEDAAAMNAAGFDGMFCNIGDFSPASWSTVRTNAAAQGMFCGPWLRTAEGGNVFSPTKLALLVATADAWGQPLICNSESEINGSGSTITEQIATAIGGRTAAISVEAIPFASVDWWPLRNYPALPQIFPVDVPAAADPAYCKGRYHAYGFECVYYTFGTYGGQTPALYDLKTPYSIYPGDGLTFSVWSPESSGFDGCTGATDPTIPPPVSPVGLCEGYESGLDGWTLYTDSSGNNSATSRINLVTP